MEGSGATGREPRIAAMGLAYGSAARHASRPPSTASVHLQNLCGMLELAAGWPEVAMRPIRLDGLSAEQLRELDRLYDTASG